MNKVVRGELVEPEKYISQDEVNARYPSKNSGRTVLILIQVLLYMALNNTMQKWTMPIKEWKSAMRQFVMLYGHRVEGY